MQDRRTLLAQGAAAAAVAAAPASAWAAAPLDPYLAYQKIMASTKDEVVCLWYLGTSFAQPTGWPEFPMSHSRTIMAYRVKHLSPTKMTVQWIEACLLLDPVNLKPMTQPINPITGVKGTLKPIFFDGPVTYTITKTPTGLSLELDQPGAKINSASIEVKAMGDKVLLVQHEDKNRNVNNKGTGGPPVLAHLTNALSLVADAAAVADPAVSSLSCDGAYLSVYDGPYAAWMGFGALTGGSVIRGRMIKARADEIVDQDTWSMLKAGLPEFFDGDRVAPRWDKFFPKV